MSCVYILQIVVPHGDAVTVETFLAWRERFEAELALERAKYVQTVSIASITVEL